MTPRGGRSLDRAALGLLLALVATGTATGAAPAGDPAWVEVDYRELLDGRRLSHSGESVAALLRRLDGRPLPPQGERPADRQGHGLLDPLVEPYAFVLTDALDHLAPPTGPPFMEVGSLWLPGERQPAWVELLRARKFVVESDGAGRMRVCVPWSGDASSGTAVDAAREGWERAWPVLRHVLAAERRRLQAGRSEAPALRVAVHAYRHRPARSELLLGTRPFETEVDDTRPRGTRPPLDLARLSRFLESGLRLEGGRLERSGALRLLGSQTERPPGVLGRPLEPSDFAVAYRAVFRGGLAEPYMSLDRGFFPQTSLVNYGGRLRDTSLGLVSLLCDIRFKTFSLGLDIVRGADLRERLRRELPEFRTHLERLAADPQSEGLAGQQTRLWFYPDTVDLTLSPESDILVLRRVRMAAASERADTDGGPPSAVAPWTRATVDAINRDYDALARFFPEMSDLDQVVRLLAFFTWLKQAAADGRPVPELDGLLALELPEIPTPRTFPQLLAFNILPGPGSSADVLVVDRVPYAQALDRLHPISGRPLAARRRFARALGGLDPQEPQHAQLFGELRGFDLDRLDDGAIDQLTSRAERAGMLARTSEGYYRRVLSRLDPAMQQRVQALQQRGEALRPSALGIGGLDLGMGQVLERARGRRATSASDAAAERAPRDAPRRAAAPVEAWRRDPAGLPELELPAHGLGQAIAAGSALRSFGDRFVEVGASGEESRRFILTAYGVHGSEVRSRRMELDGDGRASTFERFEDQRRMRYRFERAKTRLVARLAEPVRAETVADAASDAPLAPGLALLQLGTSAGAVVDPPAVTLRMEAQAGEARRSLEADVPRTVLRRLLLGPAFDATPGRPLNGFAPLPAALGAIETVMLVAEGESWAPPWEGGLDPRPGEEEPARVARALGDWWAAAGERRAAVVGVDPERSPTRWAAAPAPGGAALLLLPADGFPAAALADREMLAEAWGGMPVAEGLSQAVDAEVVVVVSAESPARFAARLGRLAADRALRGKLLAAWSLGGPLRPDLPAMLLADGNLAGFAAGDASIVSVRRASLELTALARGLGAGADRIEQLPGPFLWYF